MTEYLRMLKIPVTVSHDGDLTEAVLAEFFDDVELSNFPELLSTRTSMVLGEELTIRQVGRPSLEVWGKG